MSARPLERGDRARRDLAWRARRARALLLGALAFAAASLAPPDTAYAGPVLHEPIPPDALEDGRLTQSVDSDLSPSTDTRNGIVAAPDARRPVAPSEARYAGSGDVGAETSFRPDRDTSRPDVLPYDDPFRPSTAPFKRLMAFDGVDASYTLIVRQPRQLVAVPSGPAEGVDERFFGDLVVALAGSEPVRIPTVGPDARLLRVRASAAGADVHVRVLHDPADNWYVVADATVVARVVVEIGIARESFGGTFGDPAWSDLAPLVASLPSQADRAAAEVAAHIGVSRAMRPREALAKLVSYFRSFVDSDEPPTPSGDVYLDLALARKGVCRHRAFAFMVTALGLGLPTRMVLNEAHAWVEVHDGRMWRRIDLGGAGRLLRQPPHDREGTPYEAPPDPFSWPSGASRGADMADRSRRDAQDAPNGNGAAPNGSANPNDPNAAGPNGSMSVPGSVETLGPTEAIDDRPLSAIMIDVGANANAHRAAPIDLSGAVTAEGDPCPHLRVELLLRGPRGLVPLGVLATDEHGKFAGALFVPSGIPLGDYDVVGRTPGDARCGPSGVSSGAPRGSR